MFSLTEPQKNVIETDQFFKNTSISNIGGYSRFFDRVDLELMKKAINKLIENADGLRLRLKNDNGEISQYIEPYREEKIEIIKLDGENPMVQSEKWMRKPFGFTSKLYDFKLVELDGEEGIFIKLHHAISDAWSMAIVYSKVLMYYEALLNGEEIQNDIPSYTLFLESEKEYFNSKNYERDEEYWNEKYNEKPTFVSLASKKGVISVAASRKSFIISKEEKKVIEDFCTENGISMAVFFEAVVSLYASRTNNADDITLCTIGVNRSGKTEKKIVGMFNNILPMTVKIDWNSDFKNLCNSITKAHFEIFRHQKYPYQKIMHAISEKHGSSNIYDIMVSFQNAKYDENIKTKYKTEWIFNGCAELSFMMNIADMEGAGVLDVNIDYKDEAFTENEIEKIYARLMHIVQQVIRKKEISFKDIEVVTDDEKLEILKKFNDTKKDYPKEKRIYDFLEENVMKFPQKDALYFEGNKMSYCEFNQKVNSLANYIISKNVKHNSIIGIMQERSFEMLISIYAALKAGCAYMPMDPHFPSDRIEFMLEDSEAPIVLTNSKWLDKLTMAKECVEVDKFDYEKYSRENPKIDVSSKDVAYVIYTSGSTGKPKGAQIQHHSAINRIKWMHEHYPLLKDDVILQKTPYTFDVSVWELFWWSMYGGSLKILIPEGHKDPLEIINAIEDKNVTHMHFVPSMLMAFLQYIKINKNQISRLKTLKYVFASGEALQSEHVKDFYNLLGQNGTILINLYGPTECTVDVSCYECPKENIPSIIPIGKPIDNTQLLILDKANKLLPVGVAGELIISGVLVGKGYIKRDELTNEKFIKNEYYDFDKMYKTGDLARWLPDGNIEYLGRIDNQIKIRGLRVELGDIENTILKYASIAETVVTVFENMGEKYLCAYFTATEEIGIPKLKEELSKELPDYMVPTYYVQLDKMPLNHNGKIDRKALPKPDTNIEEKYIAPQNELEKKLQECAERALKRKNISVESDLLLSGLTSLGVIALITELSNMGIEVKVQDFYRGKSIRKLANILLGDDKKDEDYKDDENYKDISDIKDIVVETKNDGDILLTGVTGFLGIHLLEELYKTTNRKIYCIIRKKEKYDEFLKTYTSIPKENDRVITLNGDITNEKLGLDDNVYEKLTLDVSIVIHSADNVSYFCSFEKARAINYIGTCNVIEFAKLSNAKLHHISTMSVSGDVLTKQTMEYPNLTEDKLYIGQLYKENVYAYTKYLAEKEVIKNIREKKLSASIYRLPNLTWRMKDGKFQKNYEENDLYILTKVMARMNKIPLEIKNENILLAPIDDLARAIVLLINKKTQNEVYHLVSSSSPTIEGYIKMLTDAETVPIAEMYKILLDNYQDKEMQFVSMYVKGILNDAEKMVVHVHYEKTEKELEELGFKWGKIDKEYVEKIKQIGK